MASFSGPKLSNCIADDVPDIQAVLSSLAKLTPDSGNTDYPIGTKRVAETTNGYEFQQYNGTGWVTLEKWNLDAQKVDGYSASTSTTANTIPVRNANGKLPGDILGNAATATKATALSDTNPIATGGTGATTAEQARANLGTPPKTHASTSTEYGTGTSTQYGHLKSHDAPDATLTADTGHAFSPAGAASMKTELEEQIEEVETEASTQLSSLDSSLRALIAEEVSDAESAASQQVAYLDATLRAIIAEEVAKYLPLDGSQPMTGRLQLPHSAAVNSRRNDTDGTFIECSLGFHDDQGAMVITRRKDSTAYDQAGMVGLKACDGAEIKYLLGYPNGKIQWDSKTVLSAPDYRRQIYGTCDPNVRITAAETSLVICWGSVNMINGSFILVSPSGDLFTVGYYYDDQNYYSVGHSQTFICPAGWSFYAGVGFEYRIFPMGKNC